MVTGAYFPEFSSGGLQSQAAGRILKGRVRVTVITTSTTPELPARDMVDDVPVNRVLVDTRRGRRSSAWPLAARLWRVVPSADIVHVQGYSSKNILVSVVARLCRKPVVLHLQTSRHDEPAAVFAQGALARWAFRSPARFISVSAGLTAAAVAGGIPANRIVEIPNGVDTVRFAPVTADRRRQQRVALALPADRSLVLFVGVMMPDKQPHVLLQAWRRMEQQHAIGSTLVFVGATNAGLYELGGRLADDMKAEVRAAALDDRVRFIEPTTAIESFYQAADVVVLPSLREGLPNVVLEGMASSLPVVASRLPGSTDTMIEDGVTGRLVEPGDVEGFATAIAGILRDPPRAAAIGAAARKVIERRYDIRLVAEQWLAVYKDVLAQA